MTFSKKQHQQFIDEMKAHTAETIRSTVNGKIDDLKKTSLTKEDFAKYVDDDTKWKEEAQPAIDNMKNITGIWKVGVALALGIIALGGAYKVIKAALHL